jgi:26S proteasome regulatory subunit N2
VDQYIATQTPLHDELAPKSKDTDVVMHDKDPRLEAVVERMFDRCIKDQEYKQASSKLESTNLQALGVAIEARRPDTIIHVLEISKDPNLLDYVLEVAMEHVRNIHWRNEVQDPITWG